MWDFMDSCSDEEVYSSSSCALSAFLKCSPAHQCLFGRLLCNYGIQQAWRAARDGGDGCQGAGHAIRAGPSSYRLSKVVSSISAWTDTFFTLTYSKDSPSFPVSIPNIQHPLSSFLFLFLLTDLHPHSPPAWPSVVTTFTLFFSFLPFAQSCFAWHSQKHSRCRDIQQNASFITQQRSFQDSSLACRVRHFFVFYCRRSTFTTNTFFLCLFTHSSLRSDLAMSFFFSFLKKPPKNKTKHFNQDCLESCDGAAGETTDLFLHSSGQFTTSKTS